MTDERIQSCECGNETYHIKFELAIAGDVWAECAECGRPTGSLGDGMKRQQGWVANE